MPKTHVGVCARCRVSLSDTRVKSMQQSKLEALLDGAPDFVREFVTDQKNKVNASTCLCPGVVSFFPMASKADRCAPIYCRMDGRWGVSRLCRCCKSGPFDAVGPGV